jgi:uncharacterized protein (TIGR01244 family)
MTGCFRQVTDTFFVSPQIEPEDVWLAAECGVRMIVNNRPDGEMPGQPAGAEIAAAAAQAGLDYCAIPVRGMPSADQAKAMREATLVAGGPVLAYCAGGIRSILAWAIGEALAGTRSREELISLARAAGYDLSRMI